MYPENKNLKSNRKTFFAFKKKDVLKTSYVIILDFALFGYYVKFYYDAQIVWLYYSINKQRILS